MGIFKRKVKEPSGNNTTKIKKDEISVKMSGSSYFIVDIDSLVNSTVVQRQVKMAKEAIPSN
ncbi:hypothetical protein [Pseudoalteromonas fuliginea]|uniref:Uncharacterized protein n=1 Tax=Pseudoalteromonas fuliginea TaxID=1872678 RepID=A0ABQ6RJX6_9GAMM|nr:hypothetical protein [Pseudoalteromonas fuliginea]KAA1159629.1 hypothetical protein EU509_07160 [Pseudoalteromonas fuliginea]KAA1167989.1 hypothetical protein EUZ79_06765 [Pseudoalteromonas fuliginea]